MNTFWDQRYSQSAYVYGESPNAFFREQLDKLQPGSILLPGEGEGRNAVFAATSGWKADAIDSSQVGYQKAIKLAEKQNVQINYTIGDVFDTSFPEEAYDAVGLFFMHAPPQLRQLLHEKIMHALKPGGIVILEAFHVNQLKFDSGGPGNEAMLFNEARLQEDFCRWSIEKLEVSEKVLDEGVFHNGMASVIDMIVVKD